MEDVRRNTNMTIDALIRELNSLTVLEAIQLAKELERRWGVSSAIRISIYNPDNDEPVKEEKYEFDVVLEYCGPRKIEVIKVIRQLIPNCDLKEAKDISETFGRAILQGVNIDAATDAKNRLERAGATIKII